MSRWEARARRSKDGVDWASGTGDLSRCLPGLVLILYVEGARLRQLPVFVGVERLGVLLKHPTDLRLAAQGELSPDIKLMR